MIRLTLITAKSIQWMLLISIAALIFSCSAKYHEKKFFQKGGTFHCQPNDTLIVQDTILEIDSILGPVITIYKTETIYIDREVKRPETAAEKRQDRKRIEDSLKYELKVLKLRLKASNDSLVQIRKMNKQLQKTARVENRQKEKTKRVDERNASWIPWLIVLLFCAFHLFRWYTKRPLF